MKTVHAGRPPETRRRAGFTLVELLTVIAIIAILAAIIFPVFAMVRKNARRGQCISNLHQIAQALKMYKDSFGVYPEHLLGYVNPQAPNLPVTFLYPTFTKSLAVFRCPNSLYGIDGTLERNPSVSEAERVFQTRQFVPATLVPFPGLPTLASRQFPAYDSYDGQFVPNAAGNSFYELHYTRQWTDTSQPPDGTPGPPAVGDNPRQLVYRQPSEDTVVTWCLYHAEFTGSGVGAPPRQGEMALVLFLDGRVKTLPANKLTDWTPADDRNWQVRPGN